MKYSVLWMALVCVMSACGGQKQGPLKGNGNFSQFDAKIKDKAIDDTQKPKVLSVKFPSAAAKCAMPEAMVKAEQAGDVPGYLDQLVGKYQLQEVYAYSQFGEQENAVSSFSGSVLISADAKSTQFKYECKDIQGVGSAMIPISTALVVHTPSQRLSAQDAEVSNSNLLQLALFYFNSNGTASGKYNSAESPFEPVSSFKELASKWPKDHKLMVRPDGKDGFQVLYTDTSNAYIRVLMVFGK